jgi:hypothetical protein
MELINASFPRIYQDCITRYLECDISFFIKTDSLL